MKRCLFTVMILVLAVCLFACNSEYAGTYSPQEGADYSYVLEYKVKDGGAVIENYTDQTKVLEVVIPDEIDGVPVTRVDDFGIANAETLTKITIGKNVTEIGNWAFTNNMHLREFAVAEGNTAFCTIDGVLFTADKKTLLFYPIAKDITFVKNKAENKQSYVVPDTVEVIRTHAFYKCAYLESVQLPVGLRTIEEKAFHKATSLTTIALPNGLESIGKDAFAYAEQLKEITIPATVKRIDEYAFYNCNNLLKVTVLCPQDTTEFGKKWFPTKNGLDIDELVIEYE